MPSLPRSLGSDTHARTALAWAGLILIGTLAVESMPIVFGTGRSARTDWGLPYVTGRFVLLPLASLGLLCFGLVTSFRAARSHRSTVALIILASLLIPALFLALSVLVPLPWLEPLVRHG